MQTALFAETQRPMIVEGLAELSVGRGDILLGMRDAALGRGPDGRYGGGLNIDANLAIRCMDNPRRSPEDNTELARQARAADPFLDPGRPPTPAHYECAAWPEPPSRDLPWLDGDVDMPPTLTVSVTGDPAPRTRAASTWPACSAGACSPSRAPSTASRCSARAPASTRPSPST